jgi:hypothetical protein
MYPLYNHVIPLNHHSEQQLKSLYNKVKDHRMCMRLPAVAHFKTGKHKADVTRTLNVSRMMVNEWVANFFKGGVVHLKGKNHREGFLYCLPSKKPS